MMFMVVHSIVLSAFVCVADAMVLTRGAGENVTREALGAGWNATQEADLWKWKKPQPLLSFQAVLRTASGTTQDIVSDIERLAIVVNDLPSSYSFTLHSGTVLDFANAHQFNKETFFSEIVCTMTDMDVYDPRMNLSSENRTALLQGVFRTSIGQMLGAPLEKYDMAQEYEGEVEHEGRPCHVWTNRSVSNISLFALAAFQDFELLQLGVHTRHVESFLLVVQDSLDAGRDGEVSVATNATYCVANTGEVLSTQMNSLMTLEEQSNNSTHQAVLWSNQEQTNATFRQGPPSSSIFNASHGAAGGRCVDLTRGTVGASELGTQVNSAERLARINAEAHGHWEAVAYEIWEDTTVQQITPALGLEIRPLKLPLRRQARRRLRVPRGKLHASPVTRPEIPSQFDSRANWPDCISIGIVRNQGQCGSCWAFAAVSVLADRFCIASQSHGKGFLLDITMNASTAHALHGLQLSPEHLVECDGSNNGCQGGLLDNVWWYLRDHGVTTESCRPYRYCPLPNERKCAYGAGEQSHSSPLVAGAENPAGEAPPAPPGPLDAAAPPGSSSSAKCMSACEGPSKSEPLQFYQVSMAYAVAEPGDMAGIQRELLTHGPVEVGFYVFSDFHSYRRGVYFRTPGAYGPLGGHAVRLLGWGESTLPYWLVANSWSPRWGLGGFFKIRRGTNECGIESTPAAGLPMFGSANHTN